MKIAVYFNLRFGGAKRVVIQELKYLSKKNDLYIYTINTNDNLEGIGSFCKKIIKYNFRLDNNFPGVVNRLCRDWRNFITYPLLQKQIAADIDSVGYDVALIHSDHQTESPVLLRFLKTPHLFYDHEMLAIVYDKHFAFKDKVMFLKKIYENMTRQIRKNIDQKNLKKCHYIATNSKFMKSFIQKIYAKKALVIYPGVDTTIFRRSSDKRKNQVLYIGAKKEANGYKLIKAVASKIKKYDLKMRVITDSHFLRNDKILAEEYSKSLALICTSYVEAFGLKAIESMACETPVLAPREGGYKEIIKDGFSGFLLKRNADEFVKKVLYLKRNQLTAARIGENARGYVSRNFTWKAHAEGIEKKLFELS